MVCVSENRRRLSLKGTRRYQIPPNTEISSLSSKYLSLSLALSLSLSLVRREEEVEVVEEEGFHVSWGTNGSGGEPVSVSPHAVFDNVQYFQH